MSAVAHQRDTIWSLAQDVFGKATGKNVKALEKLVPGLNVRDMPIGQKLTISGTPSGLSPGEVQALKTYEAQQASKQTTSAAQSGSTSATQSQPSSILNFFDGLVNAAKTFGAHVSTTAGSISAAGSHAWQELASQFSPKKVKPVTVQLESPKESTPPTGQQIRNANFNSYVRAMSSGKYRTVYFSRDGSELVKIGGTPAWRNNNPGNVTWAPNQIGNADGFAIFPNRSTGLRAVSELLSSPQYDNRTIDGAIAKYAPAPVNNVPAYQQFVHQYTGMDMQSVIGSLNPDEMQSLVAAITRYEGWVPGQEIRYTSTQY